MKTLRAAATGFGLALALVALPPTALAKALSAAELDRLLTNMGHAPKQISSDPAKPKLQIQTTAGTFNVPLGVEITPSGRFIWVTAFLGEKSIDGARALSILRRMASIQPSQIWINDTGGIMIGITIENREVTPADLKFAIDKVSADPAATADLWNF